MAGNLFGRRESRSAVWPHYRSEILKMLSKPHLASDSCDVPRIEILTYLFVRSVFSLRDAC